MEYKSLVLPVPDKPRFSFLPKWSKAPKDLNPIELLGAKFTKVTQDNFDNKEGIYYLHQYKFNGREIFLLGNFKETNTEGKHWDGSRSYSGATQYVYDKAILPDLDNIYMLTGDLDDNDRKIMQAIPQLPPRRGGNTRRRRRSKRRNKSNKA